MRGQKVSGQSQPSVAIRPGLAVRLFGHLDVTLDGERFSLATPRKSLQVLVYLWLHRGAPVSREYLAFLLYPDDEEGAARAKLRATLSELAKILPSPAQRYVSIDTEKVAWNTAAALWLDVDEFVAASNDPARRAEAIDLYRGDLLPELYDEWLDTVRERHRNAYVRCLTERVSQARSAANFPLAIETARKVLAVDPWREDMVRRIVALRYESGDRAGALSEYANFAQRLKHELAADPMEETIALAERIARGKGLSEERAGETPATEGADPAFLPFVGRRDEMGRLLEAWSRAARGRGACAFIGGESGIGKSRLVREFAHAVEDRGGRSFIGATGTPEAVPYEGVVDVLRSALPSLTSLPSNIALASVATLVPELRTRIALPELAQLDPESERLRLFDSVFRCIRDLAAARPVLLVLEDLHWAEPASIEMLRFLLHRVVTIPAMIVVTYREEEAPRLHPLHRVRREARAASGAQSFWLSGLSAGDIEALRPALTDLRDRNAESLIAATHGSPLFLTQLVADLREGERSVEPASLSAVVSRRIERLSEHARAAAEIAACIGDRFSRDAVREVSAWDEAALTDALDELLDRRIIREAGGRGVFEYAFAHHFVFETIERSIPAERALVRHRRVARVLEELYPERASELAGSLARHYEAAGDTANAARCYLAAIRHARAVGAAAEARALCESALRLDIEPRFRAEVLLERVTIESRSGKRALWREALEALERAVADRADPELERSRLKLRIEFTLTEADLAGCESAIAALRSLVPPDDAKWDAVVHSAQARLAFSRGEPATASRCAEAALAATRQAGEDGQTIRALAFLAEVESHRGNLQHADALLGEAAEIASSIAEPALEILVTRSRWLVAYQRRDASLMRTLGERYLDLAVRFGDRPAEASAHNRLGLTAATAGISDTAAAREHFEAALRIHRENRNLAGAAGQLIDRAVLETRLGFFDGGRVATEEAVKTFAQIGDARGQVVGLGNLTFLRALTGDVDGARDAGHRALDLSRERGFEWLEASTLENLALAEAQAGEYARAIEMANASVALRRRLESVVWSSNTLADLAIWHLTLDDVPAALEAVRELLTDDRAVHGIDWPAYPFWAAARVFHRAGHAPESARALDRARRLLHEVADRLQPEDRASYLAIPFHADLLRVLKTGEWPAGGNARTEKG